MQGLLRNIEVRRAAMAEAFIGRWTFNFKKADPGRGSFGPDLLFVAKPAKGVRFELSYFANPDRWHLDTFDDDTPEDGDPDGHAESQPLARGLNQREAMDAAAELANDYMVAKVKRGRSRDESKEQDSGLDENMFMAPRSDADRSEIAKYVAETIYDAIVAVRQARVALDKAETEAGTLRDSLGKHALAAPAESALTVVRTAYRKVLQMERDLGGAEKDAYKVMDGLNGER